MIKRQALLTQSGDSGLQHPVYRLLVIMAQEIFHRRSEITVTSLHYSLCSFYELIELEYFKPFRTTPAKRTDSLWRKAGPKQVCAYADNRPGIYL